MMTPEKQMILHLPTGISLGAVKKKTIVAAAEAAGVPYGYVRKHILVKDRAVSFGYYDLTDLVSDGETTSVAEKAPESTEPTLEPERAVEMVQTASATEEIAYTPEVNPLFVRWGPFFDIAKFVSYKGFAPVYISGLSGNGKTMMVEQAAAKAKRKYVRVQISPETDEDDLIGGYRLVDGETVFSKGPVVRAMEEGALLLLDEVDRGTNKLMCLQSVLEGNPILLKKTGETIVPADGFNVIATANTKGRGSDDGRFTAASIIDDAFLERFIATIEQTWPTRASERKILGLHAEKEGLTDVEFLDKLVDWAWVIRKTFDDEGIDEVISTRRLCHAVKCHSIFGKRVKSIEMVISRFDDLTKSAMTSLYNCIDSGEIEVDSDDLISGDINKAIN